jgi:predicted PurR-regulated permease PerM
LTPDKYEDNVLHIIDDTSRLLTRYFGGILVQITIITTYVSITLSLFGVKNAILIGFFAALVNVIPYIGPLIGAMFGVLVTISANVGPDVAFYAVIMPQLIVVVIVFASMQLMDNLLLQPIIFSNSVKAHPLEIFLVILIGAQLGNIVGMLLAIPTYTVIRIIAKNMLSEFKIVQKLTSSLKS